MLREKCNFCHLQKYIFLSFFGHFFVILWKCCHFLSFWCNFLKNSENDWKILRKMTEKWQTKLKWQKNDKKMTDKTEMTKKNDQKKRQKNDKINIWTISRVWLRVSSKCKLILCVLISSLLFSHRLSSSHIYSADLSSCQLTSSQLFSAHSQIISRFLWPKICSKNGSWRQSKQPRRFPQRRFDTEKHLHRGALTEAFTHRSFHTQRAFT